MAKRKRERTGAERAPVGAASSSPAARPPRSASPAHATVPAGARRFAWAPFALAFLAGAVVYADTLTYDFVWDDLIWLDQKIRFYDSPLDIFFEPRDLPTLRVYRPLTQGTYWIDQLIWWRIPFGFHLTSVLLHAIVSGLVYLVGRRLGAARNAALVGALLFAVHPIHTESVAWITSRVDVLATVFVLLAVLAFERWRERRSWPALAAVGIASFLAASSKETGGVTPFLLVALAGVWPTTSASTEEGAAGRRRAGGGAAARLSAASTNAVAIASAAVGLACYFVLRPGDRSAGLDVAAHGFGAVPRLLGAFGFYVGRAVVPLGLDAYIPDAPVGFVVIGVAIVAAAATIAVALRARVMPLHAYALLSFAIALGPSVLVVLAGLSATAVAERYLYLPSVGLSLLVAAELSRRPALVTHPASRAAIGLVLLALATLTVVRNRVWRDDITLWTDQARTDRTHALPAMNLGVALMDAGHLAEAEAALRDALGREHTETSERDTLVNLGTVELRQEDLASAEDAFTKANAIGGHALAYTGIAHVARRRARDAIAKGDEPTAVAQLQRAGQAANAALAINPRNVQAHYLLGGVRYQLGDIPGAIAAYQQVIAIAPDTKTGADAAEALRQLTH